MEAFLRRTVSAALAGLIAGYAAALAGAIFEKETAAIPYGAYALATGVFLVLAFVLHHLFLFLVGVRGEAPQDKLQAAPPVSLAEAAPTAETRGSVAEPEDAEPDGPVSPDDREARRVEQLYAFILATREGRDRAGHLQELLAKTDRLQAYCAAHAGADARKSDEYRRTIDALLREIVADFRTFEKQDPIDEFLYDMGGFHVSGLLAEFGMNNIAYGFYRNMKDNHLKSEIRKRCPDIFAR
jgi:hypothetical protein